MFTSEQTGDIAGRVGGNRGNWESHNSNQESAFGVFPKETVGHPILPSCAPGDVDNVFSCCAPAACPSVALNWHLGHAGLDCALFP